MFIWVGLAYMAIVTLPLVFFDLRQHRLPNRLVVPALVLNLTLVVLSFDPIKIGAAVISSMVIFLLGLFCSTKGYLGMGDVKLMTAMSLLLAFFSPLLVTTAMLWALAASAVVVAFGFILKKITARSSIALGPYLLLGFWLSVIPQVWSSIKR